MKRITLDLSVELNEAINEAVKKTTLSKAQYVRMALETMNMLAGRNDAELVLYQNGEHSRILIPGVLK